MATKGITIAVGADTKAFNKEIKSMDREIKTTQKQATLLTKALDIKYDPKTFLQAQKTMQKSLDLTKEKAQKIQERMDKLKAGGKYNDKDMQKLQTDLTLTNAKTLQLENSMKELNNIKLEQFGKGLENAGEKLTKMGNAMKGLSVVATTLLASMTGIAKSTITYGDTLGTTAKQLNLTTKQLQEYNFIADQTDVSQSDFTNGIIKMQSALADFAGGEVNESSEAMQELGISTEQASKGMSANIDDIINRLSSLTSETDQARLANEIFGKRLGAKFLPLLKTGGADLANMREEFEEFGYMSDDTVSKLDAFEDELDKIKYQATVIKNTIGEGLYPVFKAIGDYITETLLPNIKKLADRFNGLSTRTKGIIVGVTAVVASLAPLLLVGGKLLTGLGKFKRSIGALGGVMNIITKHPIIAVLSILAGLLITLYNTNGKFKNSIDGLLQVLEPLLNLALDTFNQLMPMFKEMASTILPILSDVLNILGDALGDVFTELAPIVSSLLNTLLPIIKEIIATILPIIQKYLPVLIGFIGGILTTLAKLYAGLAKFQAFVLKNVFAFFNHLSEYINNFIGGVVKGVNGFIDWIGDRINNVIDFINSLIDKLNVVLKIANKELPKLSNVDISGKIKAPTVSFQKIKQSQNTGTATNNIDKLNNSNDKLESASSINNVKNSVINNDNSNKNYEVNITVEAVNGEVDVDDLVNKVNERLGGLVG